MRLILFILLLIGCFKIEAQTHAEEHYEYDRIFKTMKGYYNRGLYHKAVLYPDSLTGNKYVDASTNYFIARVYALSNEFDQTLIYLEKAVKQGITKTQIERMYDLDGFRESNMHIIYEMNYDKWHQEFLIKEQIKLAAGHKMTGKNYEPTMHSIQCRINAEDPFNDFRPSPGKITTYHEPGGHGLRIDTHVYANYIIPPYYDSMISKLIVVAQTREEAIKKMERALDEYIIEGIKSTIPFHQQLLQNKKFREGDFTTKFMETFEIKKN